MDYSKIIAPIKIINQKPIFWNNNNQNNLFSNNNTGASLFSNIQNNDLNKNVG